MILRVVICRAAFTTHSPNQSSLILRRSRRSRRSWRSSSHSLFWVRSRDDLFKRPRGGSVIGVSQVSPWLRAPAAPGRLAQTSAQHTPIVRPPCVRNNKQQRHKLKPVAAGGVSRSRHHWVWMLPKNRWLVLLFLRGLPTPSLLLVPVLADRGIPHAHRRNRRRRTILSRGCVLYGLILDRLQSRCHRHKEELPLRTPISARSQHAGKGSKWTRAQIQFEEAPDAVA